MTPPRFSGTTRTSLVFGALVVAVAVWLGVQRSRFEAGMPLQAIEPEPACGQDDPGCFPADDGGAAEPEPASVLAASDVCYGSGYLCEGMEARGELRILRWNDDTDRLRIRVPLPPVPDPVAARRLQEAAGRGIRAWHNRPFPIAVDLSDHPGDHDIVLRWSHQLGGRELGRTRTTWVRHGDGRADLRVEELSLATHNPWDPSRALPPEQVELTAAHEMGHALGLPHSSETTDVMYPENTATRLTARDFVTMSALYELENGAVVR